MYNQRDNHSRKMSNKTKISHLLKKSLGLSISNIWRNKILSSATIFVTATIIFIFNIILAVNFIANSALQDLNKKIDITVYLKEDTTYEQTEKLVNEIKSIKEVEAVTLISKEKALKEFKVSHPNISLSFEKYGLGNPLPASLNITTIDAKYHSPLIEYLSQDKYKVYFSNISRAEEENGKIISSVSKNLLELTNFTKQIIFWLIVIFVLGGTLIVVNALQINIFSRKKEITIMKLVGASNWFIRSPFMIESIIYGTLSVILSFVMLLVLSKNIQIEESSLFSYYSGINFYIIFIMELIATVVLCVVSSMITVHEHLRKDIL